MSKSQNDTVNKLFSSNLRRLLAERGIEQQKLANDLDHTTATMSYWCTGKKTPSMQAIGNIAEYLNVPIAALLSEGDTQSTRASYRMKVPVANGNNITYVDEYFLSDEKVRKADFAIIADDDSMSPRILKGDIILCSETSSAINGDLVVADVDGKQIIRRLFVSPAVSSLVAENPSVAPIAFDEKGTIVGIPFLVQRRI